jgi:DNA-binding MarR family transcriptional regulator
MKLTQRQIEFIEFCEEPKFVEQISERFQIQLNSVYPHLRRLVKNGFIKSESGYMNQNKRSVKLFISVKSAFDAQLTQHEHEIDTSSINMDFVRAAHNPFNIGAHHG